MTLSIAVKGKCSVRGKHCRGLKNLEEGAHVSYRLSRSVDGTTHEKEGKKWPPNCSDCQGRVLMGVKNKRGKKSKGE